MERQSNPEQSQRFTPETVSKLIRFSLSELSTENSHHEFEHLCRHVARRRICSNILPATGPVSGGGDRGADFETVPVVSTFGNSRYWRLVSREKILFACSLEKHLKKKVRADTKAAAAFGQPIETLYFFYHLPIKIGDRNKLKEEAKINFGVALEIVDGVAIAEFLADPELLWIAERYLSLPSGIELPSPSTPLWYSEVLAASESQNELTSDAFFQIKAALRHATAQPDLHSDVPKLIRRLRRFSEHHILQRKVFYEEFVSVLRGLNAAEGYEQEVLTYLSAIPSLTDIADLEDAAVILGYLTGACARGLLNVDPGTRLRISEDLLSRLDHLLGAGPSFVNCSLLFTKGYVVLNSVTCGAENAGLPQAVEAAARVWILLLKRAKQVPLFPVERLSPIVNFIYPAVSSQIFTDFVGKLDELIRERAGSQQLAQQLLSRASGLLEVQDYLRALDEFHRALLLSHALESQFTAITICLQLSALYNHIRLYHAGKYYALAAAYAAQRFPEDELRKLTAVGLAQAAEADYATGASLLYFLTYRAFVILASEFAIAGRKPFREEQWAKVDFYATLLTRAAAVLNDQLHDMCKEFITQLGSGDIYAEHGAELDKIFGDLDSRGMAARYDAEGIATPFSDYGVWRQTAWKQLGINWHLEWRSGFSLEQCGEALCAVLQIMFAAFTGTEFSAVASDVHIAVEPTAEIVPRAKQVADNQTLRIAISVNPAAPWTVEDYLSLAYYCLVLASALDEEEFKNRFEEEFKRGLPERTAVYVSPLEVFRQFYSTAEYEELHRLDRSAGPVQSAPVRTWSVVADVSNVHPQFVESEALKQIANRYARIRKLYPRTVERVLMDPEFKKTAAKLRADGWKDWHILLAVANVRASEILNQRQADDSEEVNRIATVGEKIDDPEPSMAVYDEARLRLALQMSQLSTIRSLGLRMSQRTPNFPGMEMLLRRFKYWDLDVQHEQILPEEPSSSSVGKTQEASSL